MEVSGHLHAPTDLPSGKKPPVPTGQEAGWAPGSVWMLCRREKSCTAGNLTRNVQPVAGHYTDSTIPTPGGGEPTKNAFR
jgi:hypothetical protein